MSGIVCAIRGGPSSRSTLAKAMALAREINHPLYLLYVVNLDSLPRSGGSQIGLIFEQMRQLGESILLGAQEIARAQGIVAEHRVRHGNVGEEISGLCHELDAEHLVLGRPKAHREDNVFTPVRLASFIKRVQRETGARVIQPSRSLTSRVTQQ